MRGDNVHVHFRMSALYSSTKQVNLEGKVNKGNGWRVAVNAFGLFKRFLDRIRMG